MIAGLIRYGLTVKGLIDRKTAEAKILVNARLRSTVGVSVLTA